MIGFIFSNSKEKEPIRFHISFALKLFLGATQKQIKTFQS